MSSFQCSSASRKFLNVSAAAPRHRSRPVSVLFSEPKIPQSVPRSVGQRCRNRFSALQRAENSSIVLHAGNGFRALAFQCSSASRKFLNPNTCGFEQTRIEFQCSSASRKFLNALVLCAPYGSLTVSVLFSEPKIPQSSMYMSLV